MRHSVERLRFCPSRGVGAPQFREFSNRAALSPSCVGCNQAQRCYPPALTDEDAALLSSLTRANRKFKMGDLVVRAGDPFTRLLVIKAGTLKTFVQTQADIPGEKVIGFHGPGEVLGLDGAAECRHLASSRALESGVYCEVPILGLDAEARSNPGLQHHLFRLFSQGLVAANSTMSLLNFVAGAQRVSAFLLSLSDRNASLGLAPDAIRLTMSRADIASFLGMATETVSRLLGRLNHDGVIAVEGKTVRILDPAALRSSLDDDESLRKPAVRPVELPSP